MSKFVQDTGLALILGGLKTKLTEADAALLVTAKEYADTKFGNIPVGLSAEIVAALPTENFDPKVIYLVPKTVPATDNIYDQYMYINSKWELIGDTTIDLTNYYTKTEIDTVLSTNYYNKTEIDSKITVMSDTDVTTFISTLLA